MASILRLSQRFQFIQKFSHSISGAQSFLAAECYLLRVSYVPFHKKQQQNRKKASSKTEKTEM